mmetsp:Transcript_6269/g.18640  ORF Transcript_6269/g.18640 Transcript_6269/m.18640 type:complete len:239 (-) Transcript_6269:400-1116(-)
MPPALHRPDVYVLQPSDPQGQRDHPRFLISELSDRIVPPAINFPKILFASLLPLPLPSQHHARVPHSARHLLHAVYLKRLHDLGLQAVVQRAVAKRAELAPPARQDLSIERAHRKVIGAARDLFHSVLASVKKFGVPRGLAQGVHRLSPEERLPLLGNRRSCGGPAAHLGHHASLKGLHLHGPVTFDGGAVPKLARPRESPRVDGAKLVNNYDVVLAARDLKRVKSLLAVKEGGEHLI